MSSTATPGIAPGATSHKDLLADAGKGVSVGLATYVLGSLLDADTLAAAFGPSETPLRVICPGLLVLLAVWLVWLAARRPRLGLAAGVTILAAALLVMLTSYPAAPWPVPFGAPNQTDLGTATVVAHGAAAPIVPVLGAVPIAVAALSGRRQRP